MKEPHINGTTNHFGNFVDRWVFIENPTEAYVVVAKLINSQHAAGNR